MSKFLIAWIDRPSDAGGAADPPKPAGSKGNELAAALKDQLALLSFLVLFGGIVSTATYYAGFAVRYQFLDLPVTHLIYRGLTATIENWPLRGAYLAAMAWLAVGADLVSSRGPIWARWAPLGTYSLITVVVAVSYTAASDAGRKTAQADLMEQTSELPMVQAMTSAKGEKLPFAGFRLLDAGKDTVILFKATGSKADQPNMHILRREDVGEIVLSR